MTDQEMIYNSPDAKTRNAVARRSRRSVFAAFIEQGRKLGGGTLAVIDGDGRRMSYRDIARAAFALQRPISEGSAPGETIGVLLPTGAGVLITLFALHAAGHVPAMLNFTAGSSSLINAGRTAQIRRIVTARKFVEIGKLGPLIEALAPHFDFIYLEDLRKDLSRRDKLRALVGPIFPRFFMNRPNPDETGVILFTSGTEGRPKGVALSHRNILANIEQISKHVVIEPTDIFFNPLPAFHCYGLTAGSLWPVIRGYPVVFHPSPLQTKIIPKRIFETSATVLFATDTFLTQYMRASDEGGMSSLRLAVCGAERVRDETRQMAERKFAFTVLEGYGVTEGSPVLAANQPDDIRAGTVGKLLPTVEAKLEPVAGLEGGGRLFVRGPNIMQGYLLPEKPGEISARADDEWYDTGDVVSIDKYGYVAIRGRMKRFAKIGGEMVSLTVVENCASAVWPDNDHAAAIVPDPKKGEQIVLLTNRKGPARADLQSWAQSHGVPEIAVPRKIFSVDEIPVLGTGKTDFRAVTAMAEALIHEPEPKAEMKEKKQRAADKQKLENERLSAADGANSTQAEIQPPRTADDGPARDAAE